MAEKIPKVLMLKPIRPDSTSVDGEQLTYPNLAPAVAKHRPYTAARWNQFLHEQDPIGSESDARALASQYLLMTALKATTTTTAESRALWANRFTDASTELYGNPDSAYARTLFSQQVRDLDLAEAHTQMPEFVAKYISANVDSMGESVASLGEFKEAASGVADYFYNEYSDVMQVFDDLPDVEIQPEEVAEIFKTVLDMLSSRDPAWGEYVVELTDSDKLSATAGKINVGKNRRSVTPSELKGLCGHEILVHAQRAVNGKKLDAKLASGLPGYLDAEEGLGVFVEYALTGEIPQKIIDRYIDISAALGGVFDHPLSRNEMYNFVFARDTVRAEKSGEMIDLDKLKNKTWEHVNRIYRGSRGDEFIGVFTKDIAYLEGFILIGNYIQSQLAEDRPISAVIEYVSSGKFDPTNPDHVKYHSDILKSGD